MLDFIRKFTKKHIQKQNERVIKIDGNFFLINKTLDNTIKKINKKPFSAGVPLGKKERPSLALLERVAKNSNKKIYVDDKGEWLFTCKRDLFGKSITKVKAQDNLILIQNKHDENLGYGKVIGNLKKKDQVVIKNQLDKGAYLRMER